MGEHQLHARGAAARRSPATLWLIAIVSTLMLCASGIAIAGPLGYTPPKLKTSTGAATAGQSVTVSPVGPCRPGHGGRGTAGLFAPIDGSYTAPQIASAPAAVRADGMWNPVTVVVPENAPAGTYTVSFICGGIRDVTTSYQGVALRVMGYCSKPYFVGMRGSGEPASGPWGMGPTLDYVFRMTRQNAGGVPFDVIRPEQQSRYQAVAFPSPQYWSSMESGKNLALENIRARVRACEGQGGTRIVLAGYSQGAHAIYEALRVLSTAERNSIKGVVLFGNPVHTPYVNGDAGEAHLVGTLGPRVSLPDGLPNRMRDYCNRYDPICGIGLANIGLGMLGFESCKRAGAACTHTHYLATRADEGAAYLAGRL